MYFAARCVRFASRSMGRNYLRSAPRLYGFEVPARPRESRRGREGRRCVPALERDAAGNAAAKFNEAMRAAKERARNVQKDPRRRRLRRTGV